MKTLYLCRERDELCCLMKEYFRNSTILESKNKNVLKKILHYDLIFINIHLEQISAWGMYNHLKDHYVYAKVAFVGYIPLSDERIEELKNEGISGYILLGEDKEEILRNILKLFH